MVGDNMKKIAIVILNYLNYWDTIECVESALRIDYKDKEIVIVDNGSSNESFERLNKEFKSNHHIFILQSKKNVGFAKGNNIGIKFSRCQLKADYILVVNNDVVFRDWTILKKMRNHDRSNIGIIGCDILLSNGFIQKPYKVYLGFPEILYKYIVYIFKTYPLICNFFWNKLDKKNQEEVLHGCILFFTPSFFKYYKGFYPKTFLYCEEEILKLMCKMYGLKQKKLHSTYIYHKEDQSSLESWGNDEKVKGKYSVNSYKYVIWWRIKFEIKSKIKKSLIYIHKFITFMIKRKEVLQKFL